jgi:hypothetical protein
VVGTPLDNVERLDAGVSVFAGWTDEPNVGALRRFLNVTPADMRQNLLHVLLEDAGATTPQGQEASSWASVCDRLAAHVVRAFATRIRGFRQSSREFMVRSFLHAPGRVSVESDRVKVVLSRNPFWVAVHLSGADTRVERVSWLGDRSLEFELEGL